MLFLIGFLEFRCGKSPCCLWRDVGPNSWFTTKERYRAGAGNLTQNLSAVLWGSRWQVVRIAELLSGFKRNEQRESCSEQSGDLVFISLA